MHKEITTREAGENQILSFFTSEPKSKFNQAKLFDEISCSIKSINQSYTCYLSIYPKIAVHVICGCSEQLIDDRYKLKARIDKILTEART
jgi:hypothetical protein